MKKLEKTNVILKEFQASDVDEFYRIAKIDEVKKYVKILYPEDKDEAKIIIEMLTCGINFIAFKIEDNNSNFVGAIVGEKIEQRRIDVLYFIGRDYRGRGYCIEAIKQFEKYLAECNYEEMLFAIEKNNKDSKRVMKRLKIPFIYIKRFEVYIKRIK